MNNERSRVYIISPEGQIPLGVSTKEVARRLGVAQATAVKLLAAEGISPTLQSPGLILYDEATVDTFVARRSVTQG